MQRTIGGGLLIGALVLLILETAHAAANSDVARQGQNSAFVTPDNIYDHQPFSFAATQVAEGEVVSIQTADGIVVQRSHADKYGRVFLAAGLRAGAYLVSLAGSDSPHGREAWRIEVHQRPGDALDSSDHPHQFMQIVQSPQFVKLSDQPSLTGHGFNPNAADMQASVSASGQTHIVPVLAATEDQLKLAPVTQLSPGMAQLRITNNAIGESTEPRQFLLYDIQGHLERRKLTTGSDQTHLVVKVQPHELVQKVKVSVVSGPVDFGGGQKEAEAVTRHGQAVFPVHAEKGAGPFQLTWELVLPSTATAASDMESARADGDYKIHRPEPPNFSQPQSPSHPVASTHQDHGTCTCTVTGGGGTKNLSATKSERPAPRDLDLSPLGNQQQQDDWARWRKDRPMFDNYLGTVKVTFDILEATVLAQGDNNDELHVNRTTWLTITSGTNVQFEIFRKGNKGYLPINSRGDNMTLRCPRDQQTFKGIDGEEYLIEMWVPKSANAPATLTVQVDAGDAITPCGFNHHQTASYELTFDQMGVSKVRKVK